MNHMPQSVLEEIAAETAEWIAEDLLARAEREADRADRYRSAAIAVRARAQRHRARARRAWSPESTLVAG